MQLSKTAVQKIRSMPIEGHFDSVTPNEIIIRGPWYCVVINDLDFLKKQSGIEVFVDLPELMGETPRNTRKEVGEEKDLNISEVVNLRGNLDIRLRTDCSTLSRVNGERSSFRKTILETNENYLIYIGDHFDYILGIIRQSPIRFFKERFPALYNYLIEIEEGCEV